MRALALAFVLLAPVALATSAAPAGADVIVTLRAPMAFPANAVPLTLFHGFVLRDATDGDVARLAADERVERVDRAVPLSFSAQPRLATRALTQLTRAHDTGLDGAGVTVAIVDSGIDSTHPDLAGRVRANVRLLEGQFLPSPGDPDGHGTHVAGVLAASGAASDGRWTGVAPAAELVGVDISSRFTTASAVLAYDWLLAREDELGVRVVVNAWGRVNDGDAFDPRDPVMRAIDRLADAGVVVVFSASNHGPLPGTLSVEAMHPRVVTVGATDGAGVPVGYSSRGPATSGAVKPDVVAPGDAVVGPRSAQSLPREGDPGALHTVYSGTSQAAPHVAGIVALMLQAEPRLTPDEVADALRASAIDLGPAGPDDATGYGLVDAHDALRIARGAGPDRRNVLVTGGVDRYQESSELPPTAGRGLLGLVQRPEVVWETAFAVKPGAQRLRASAEAPGAQGLDVELAKDGQLVRGGEIERPDAGVWTLRLRGSVPLATSASAIIETELAPQPARALAFDGRALSPAPAPEPQGWTLAVPLGALVVGAVALVVLAAALWPRRPAPGD